MNDFCIFILTHGRPNSVFTWETLRKVGVEIPIYIIIDSDDQRKEEYFFNFGDRVVVFDKAEIKFETAENFGNKKCISFARNACFDIAGELGYEYFIQLDDDYTHFNYRFDSEYRYQFKTLRKIDDIFYSILDFYKKTPFTTLSISQGGDFFGGEKGKTAESISIRRKAMNSFFCSTSRPFQFIGMINEDVNTYVHRGSQGVLIGQINNVALQQRATQQEDGGMSETYLNSGTYVKSFYTILFAPSCTKIRLMGESNMRLHHSIKWENAVVKILHEKQRKQR
jgi:hypothetical protein